MELQSVANKMKFAVAIVALVSVCGVSGSNPKVHEAWVEGAISVNAPLTEAALSGDQVKDDIINSVNTYLLSLDTEFNKLYGTWAYDVQRRCSQNYREIENRKIHIQMGGNANFDGPLAALANEYISIISGINGEGRMSQKKIQGVETDLHHLLAPKSRPVAGLPRYTLEEQFFSYKNAILERDFQILATFLLDLFEAGYNRVATNAPQMEKNHRLDNLWPLVDSLQKQSHNIENDQDIIAEYTNPAIYQEYIKARTALWEIDVATKINEDQH